MTSPKVITLTNRAIYLVGAGGHAAVLRETLNELGLSISGYITIDGEPTSTTDGLLVIRQDDVLDALDPTTVHLVNAIGSTSDLSVRAQASEFFTERGFEFATVVSAHALVAESALVAAGAQVLRGAIVNTGARVDINAIINSGAIVEHHATVGANSHVAPGAVVCGASHVGHGVHVGAGATVVQGVSIGDNSVIGAGAVVLHDVPAGTTAVGVPARATTRKVQS